MEFGVFMANNKLAKTANAQVVMSLKDLVYGYIEARDKVAALQDQAKPYKEAKEAIQSEIVKNL